ncbi:MAG: protein of unknown function DitE [Phycisphaerales bacterium]|nr:protein of unknown function DitE [Phycisphaerales bacterium]
MMRALRSRNYRLFFGGQLVSLVGNFLTGTATAWLVYKLTESPFKLGIVGFVGQFPMFVLAPFAGVWADRLPLRRTLVATQIAAMIQSLVLAAVVLSGHANFAILVVLSLVQGLINSIDIPARQSFVVQMLEDRRDLPNAIALNSSMVNAAKLIGPSLAGLLIAAIGTNGEGWCFLLDGLSYIAVIFALLAMRRLPAFVVKQHPAVLHSLKEGFRASFGFPPIRAILLLLTLVSLAGVPYMVLMPVFAKDILHGNALLLGLLGGASGLGALGGAVYLASRKSVVGISRALVAATIMFGASLIVFAYSTNIVLSMCMMPLIGASMLIQMAGSNTLLQTLADDHLRGRIMAMFTMCFMGTVPIGSLICGLAARSIGVQATVASGGVICIAGALVFNRARPKLRPHVLPIYIKRGILPEVALGVDTATLATEHVNG